MLVQLHTIFEEGQRNSQKCGVTGEILLKWSVLSRLKALTLTNEPTMLLASQHTARFFKCKISVNEECKVHTNNYMT